MRNHYLQPTCHAIFPGPQYFPAQMFMILTAMKNAFFAVGISTSRTDSDSCKKNPEGNNCDFRNPLSPHKMTGIYLSFCCVVDDC